MKIELPPSTAAKLRPVLVKCADGNATPNILAGQVRAGFWDEGTDKTFLIVRPITAATALKMRKLIEKEQSHEP
ncbi:MAG: hypothetical protein M3R59_03190 [Verrucomicrobiota bacterium]|nr:hypothetical protein [Verrucomicrobiota bacterium]